MNGRLLGVYILVEGITKDFLGRNFSDSLGNLYEGETQDVDGQVQQDSGARPGDRADLDKLVKAVHEPNPEARMRRFEEVLDVNQFQSFMAVEILLVHNDGYCLRKNNYRLYNDPGTGRFNFIPHGMDFLFGNPYTLVLPEMNGMVATSLLEIPGQTNAYKARIALLETNVLDLAGIRRRVEEISAVVRPVLEKDGPKLAAQQKQAAEFFIQRVAARVAVVREQIVQWEKEAKREEKEKANSSK